MLVCLGTLVLPTPPGFDEWLLPTYVLSEWQKYVLGLREDRQRTYNHAAHP